MSRLIRVEDYLRADGSRPFRRWFEDLHAPAAAKVDVALKRIELGNLSRIKWFSGIGECRIDWGPGYRVYLGRDGDTLVILLGGGTKQRQQSDIERAQAMWAEYQARKGKR
jgi:putative addiction module killer protein